MGAGANMGGQPSFPAPGQTDNAAATEGQPSPQTQSNGQQPQQPPQSPLGANPFATLFGGASPGLGAGTGAAPQPNLNALFNLYGGMQSPFGVPPAAGAGNGSSPAGGEQPQQPPAGANPFMNPAAMQQMLQMMGGMPGGSVPPADLLSGLFGGMPPAAASPPDNRPPEERYAEQLRQLNEMGFFDFDRNVEALRRSGGSVQGAINQLLGG
jgi:ubiquilin